MYEGYWLAKINLDFDSRFGNDSWRDTDSPHEVLDYRVHNTCNRDNVLFPWSYLYVQIGHINLLLILFDKLNHVLTWKSTIKSKFSNAPKYRVIKVFTKHAKMSLNMQKCLKPNMILQNKNHLHYNGSVVCSVSIIKLIDSRQLDIVKLWTNWFIWLYVYDWFILFYLSIATHVSDGKKWFIWLCVYLIGLLGCMFLTD